MTVEQRAEEYKESKRHKSFRVDVGNIQINYESYLNNLRQAFIDGYHECEKKHEWHYVKDGDLPTHTRQVLVYLKSDDVDIDCYGKCLGWKNHLNEQIKAWKEIVLPKESE